MELAFAHGHVADLAHQMYLQPKLVRNIAEHWKAKHERKVNARIAELKQAKHQRDLGAEKEASELITRKVPFEYFSRDWLDEQMVSLESRVYLLEKLIPTLVMGVEKLLIEAEKRCLIENNAMSKDAINKTQDFNPVNFLAQYLMRNNPKYSNFAEASPYIKSIRRLLDDLKEKAFNAADKNKLARMKADARKRRTEKERLAQVDMFIKKGKPEALQELFMLWTGDRSAVISLSLVQSALRSFQDYVTVMPLDVQRESMFAVDVPSTDVTGKLINIREFVEFVGKYVAAFSENLFRDFCRHLSRLASEYQVLIEVQAIRGLLGNLFMSCDFAQTGFVDRLRVLKLLCLYYDGIVDAKVKALVRNPRKWPVIEFEEEVDEIEDYIEGRKVASDDPASEKHSSSHETETGEEEPIDARRDCGSQDGSRKATGAEGPPETGNDWTQPAGAVVNVEVGSLRLELPSRLAQTLADKNLESASAPLKTDDRSAKLDGCTTDTDLDSDDSDEVRKTSAGKIKAGPLPHTVGSSLSLPREVTLEEEVKNILEAATSRSTEPEAIPGVSRPYSVTSAAAFDKQTFTLNQFINVLMTFLGDCPPRTLVESLVRFLRCGYAETEDERNARMQALQLEQRQARRRVAIDQLFDLWDVDCSGYLEANEIEMVLAKWREDDIFERVHEEAIEVFGDVYSKISKRQFARMIDQICDVFPKEDVFDNLIHFLTTSVQKSFEERMRGDLRKKWMAMIDFAAKTSGCLMEPLFKSTFQALESDSRKHGKDKVISAYVALVERTDTTKYPHTKGDELLRYVACTPADTDLVLNHILHRGMQCVSFAAVDSGKPIHVPRVLAHGGVHLWNPLRKDEKVEGSFICLPLKDQDKNVLGILGVDTLRDAREIFFVSHEISFYQGVAKSLSQAMQFVDIRRKTIKVSESAVSWILRRSPNVHEVTLYLIEPALKASEGSVLRKMACLSHSTCQRPEVPPRLERKDHLFRDYLFKCIDTSETLTADAYGERHLAFPLRDIDGLVVSIVDISIGELKQLPPHELMEIHRMLKLLEIAHREMSREAAGEDKNMVLDVEKEHQENRIEVLFDRIMLQDLRANVGRLDARAFAEIKSYKDPPKIVHDILKAVLGIFFNGREDQDTEAKLEEWSTAKQLVNNELVKWITTFDPTSGSNLASGAKLSLCLAHIRPGAVAKHGSLPAQYLFNWAFVCLSLIEHASKMRDLCKSVVSTREKVKSGVSDAKLPSSENGEH